MLSHGRTRAFEYRKPRRIAARPTVSLMAIGTQAGRARIDRSSLDHESSLASTAAGRR